MYILTITLRRILRFHYSLRFFVWTTWKIVPRRARLKETLQFLLDHPRRCFVYLFPSHQTWFLLSVLVLLKYAMIIHRCKGSDFLTSATDWFFFLVLDIGNPELESIPIGTRIAIGLLQASAVRASGFGTVTM